MNSIPPNMNVIFIIETPSEYGSMKLKNYPDKVIFSKPISKLNFHGTVSFNEEITELSMDDISSISSCVKEANLKLFESES